MAVHHNTPEDGIALLTAGLGQCQTMGVYLLAPYFLSFLAEGYRCQGKGKEALQTVQDALTLTSTNLDVFWEAELYRLQGELTLAQPSVQSRESRGKKGPETKSDPPHSALGTPHAEAEACFLEAIEIARRQEAKLLELRATTSLARLWQQQGKQKEARQRLARIYHWFTEGLETKDLQAAKTVLAELA
jgi:predicted ATPase